MQLATINAPADNSPRPTLRSVAERDQLVKDHLWLVEMIANALRGLPIASGVSYQDLVAYGSTGLIEAAERFDSSKGVPFKTFARYRVRGAMVDGIRSHHWLSRRAYDRLRLEQLVAGAEPANDVGGYCHPIPGRRPSATPERHGDAEYADDTSHAGTANQIDARWNRRRMVQLPVSDDTVHFRLRAAIEQLPFKERRLLELCYFADKTLEQAGSELGMQRSWACRLHGRALDALRSLLGDISPAPGP